MQLKISLPVRGSWGPLLRLSDVLGVFGVLCWCVTPLLHCLHKSSFVVVVVATAAAAALSLIHI